jgi:hypothetical protein
MPTIITQEEGATINHQTSNLTMANPPNVAKKVGSRTVLLLWKIDPPKDECKRKGN